MIRHISRTAFSLFACLTLTQASSQLYIKTVAGSGYNGTRGDGGPALCAGVPNPTGVCIDPTGNIYIASVNSIRRVDATTGIITTIAGTGANSFTGDGGLAINGSMFSPQGTALGFNGNFYIADVQNQRIRVLTTTLPQPPVISKVAVTINPELPCRGSTVTFEAVVQNAGTGQTYQWYVNDNPVGPNSATFSTADVNDGDLVKCVFSSDQCTGPEEVTSNEVSVVYGSVTAPTVGISSTAAKVCPGETITLTASVQNGSDVSYQWYMNDGAVGDGTSQFTYTPVNSEDRVRCDVSLTGCAGGVISTETVNTGVYVVPVVSITPQEATVPPGTVVQLSANATGDLQSYSWISAEPLSNSTSLNAVTSPVINSHPVIFVGETADGCVVSDTMNIFVFIKMIMPNAFTPNRDGNNDIFRIPPNVKFTLKEFAIFDRWGKKVFATADITRGWTGENAVNGTYVYLITGEIDGQKTTFKGTVVLSR
ncbi:MAG: gliding motility-associated C-terminal domain-containing protein [Chitinophagaceae bacterium]|nr:gliding motility-associated C-terminal domain-containing protein [Chitinophagaceae bacterium]